MLTNELRRRAEDARCPELEPRGSHSAAATGSKGRLKPATAALPPALSQRDCVMAIDPRVDECGAVAEAFADVITPRPGARLRAGGFLEAGRFAELAAGSMQKFLRKQMAVFGTFSVAEPCPHEVKQFVDKDQPQ